MTLLARYDEGRIAVNRHRIVDVDSAVSQQQTDDLSVTLLARYDEGRIAVNRRHLIDVDPGVGQQQTDNLGVAVQARYDEGRAPVTIHRIDVNVVAGQQQTDDLGVGIQARDDESRTDLNPRRIVNEDVEECHEPSNDLGISRTDRIFKDLVTIGTRPPVMALIKYIRVYLSIHGCGYQ